MLRFLLGFVLAAAAGCAAAQPIADDNGAASLAACRPLWIGMRGVPEHRERAVRDTTFVCHARFLRPRPGPDDPHNGYLLSHDNVSKTPDWVIERLTRAGVSGNANRPGAAFKADPGVPPQGRARDDDYPPRQSGFARGHMAPSEDFNTSRQAMRETFFLSNTVPQRGARFNGSVWAALEDETRKAAIDRGAVYVITGPVRGPDGARSLTIAQSDNACGKSITLDGPDVAQFCQADGESYGEPCDEGGVGVPIGIFKIILTEDDAYAFVMPNRDHDRHGVPVRTYLEGFRVSIAALEAVTGLEFFRNIPEETGRRLIEQCAPGTLW